MLNFLLTDTSDINQTRVPVFNKSMIVLVFWTSFLTFHLLNHLIVWLFCLKRVIYFFLSPSLACPVLPGIYHCEALWGGCFASMGCKTDNWPMKDKTATCSKTTCYFSFLRICTVVIFQHDGSITSPSLMSELERTKNWTLVQTHTQEDNLTLNRGRQPYFISGYL